MCIIVVFLFLTLLTVRGSSEEMPCLGSWFDCGNGKCIAEIWICDGENDCGNLKDEQDCSGGRVGQHCMSSQFVCESGGHCIPETWRCDGQHDCEDGSDEAACDNSTSDCTAFSCKDHECIPTRWHCDGHKDCRDGSDEEMCPTAQLCPDDDFPCGSGACLNRSAVCDGKKDCTDGSDEGAHCGDSCTNSTCSQHCESTPSGPHCYCNEGYILDRKDNSTCLDIDECQVDGFCSHSCTNLPGGYNCSCLEGYRLVNGTACQAEVLKCPCSTVNSRGKSLKCLDGYRLVDGTGCQAEGADPLLIFATIDEIRGMRLRSGQYFLVMKALLRATAVDADPTSERIFWIELSNKSAIYSAKINGRDLRTVLNHGLLVPEDIVVDYVAGNLYLTDSGLRQVLVCKMDGTMCHVLHDKNVGRPRSILVDPSEGFLYWSDWGEQTAGIYRSGMDGSGRIALVSTDIGWPNGIAIDHTINRLFWADAKRNTIESISLDGNSRKVVLDGFVFHPYSLAVFEDKIYWTDWSTFSLESCNKFTGHKMTLLTRENGKHILGIHVYHPVLAYRVANPCWSSQCSHMCLLSPGHSFRCACPPGFILSSDSRTCTTHQYSPGLFVSEGSTVFYIRPGAVGSEALTELPLPLRSAQITKVAYDPTAKLLFVADTNAPAIHAINMTSLRMWELVKNHLTSPEDIALDTASNNLYWVDSSKGTVEMISVGQQKRATLVEGLKVPFSIAISRFGYIFVASIEAESVSMYDMDGKNPKLLRSVQGYPLSVAVHPTKSLLYWADLRAGTISYMNFTTFSSSRVVVSRLEGVTSVVSSEDSLYWTTRKREIHYMKSNRTYVIALPGQQSQGVVVRKMTYSQDLEVSAVSPCSVSNGGCSHLCLLSPRGRTCLCPPGTILSSDNTTCMDQGCSETQFKCSRSGRCLSAGYRCDGRRDCSDGSDEIGCDYFCSGDDFKCRNGRCIIKSWHCDRRDDCGDNSDEVDCPEPTVCAVEQIQCGDGDCIPKLWRCDGAADCLDGTDESGCEVTRCDPESQIRCDNGQCVPISWRCDGTNDCYDGTDEKNCSLRTRCGSSDFKCEDDGSCLEESLRCDGRRDCEDGSDEKNCKNSTTPDCKKDMFHCSDGFCIYDYEVCDGHEDCVNNEDERNCTHTKCQVGELLCPVSKRCILMRWICDGDQDCIDGSDENNCTDPPMTQEPYRYIPLASECDGFLCYATGKCLPWTRVCDGQQDCGDMPDEGGSCNRACSAGDNGGCAQDCQKTPQGSKCFCFEGYRLLPDKKTCEDIDECQIPGTCSHFCNNTKGGFKCRCADGYFLHHNHRECKADGGPASLVFLLGDQIRSIDLVSHSQIVHLRLPDADMTSMDYDAADGLFYWTERIDGSINSYSSDTHRQDVIVRSPLRPSNIRYDWIARNLYYSDEAGNIGVCSKDGRFCSTLLISGATNVNSLDISPTTGLMFWTVWSSLLRNQQSGIVVRAEMDGSVRQDIISSKMNWPTALAVDQLLKMIYWIDMKLNTLECADFQGFQRRQIVGSGMYHPYSIAIFEDIVYWADWGHDSIFRCNKFADSDCSRLKEGNVKAIELLVIYKVMQPKGINKCLNSGCPHLCLPTRSSFVCKCADGFTQRNDTCELPPETTPAPFPTECPKDYCLAEGVCTVENEKFICKCKERYSGPKCEIESQAVDAQYDYSWIVAVVFAMTVTGIIVLVIMLCMRNRDKLHRVSESVTVKFRNTLSGREGRHLVGDTDDGGVCDELVLGHEGDYRSSNDFKEQTFSLSGSHDGSYKRWPPCDSQTTVGDSIAHFFGRLKRTDSPQFYK